MVLLLLILVPVAFAFYVGFRPAKESKNIALIGSLACLARGETEKSKIFASLFPPLLFGFKKNPTGPGP